MENCNLYNSKKNHKIIFNNNNNIIGINNKDKTNLSNDYFDFNTILPILTSWKQKLSNELIFISYSISYLNRSSEYQQQPANKSILLLNLLKFKKEFQILKEQLNDFLNDFENKNLKFYTYDKEAVIKNKYKKFSEINDKLINKFHNYFINEPLMNDIKDEFIKNKKNATNYSQKIKKMNQKLTSITKIKTNMNRFNYSNNEYSGINTNDSNRELFSQLCFNDGAKTERSTHNYLNSNSLFHNTNNKLTQSDNKKNLSNHKNNDNKNNSNLILKNSISTDKVVLNAKKIGKNFLYRKKTNNLNKYIKQNKNIKYNQNKINKKFICSTIKNIITNISISKKDESKEITYHNNANKIFDVSIKKIYKDQNNITKNPKKQNYSVQRKKLNKFKILDCSPKVEYLQTSNTPAEFTKVINKFQSFDKDSRRHASHSLNKRQSYISDYKAKSLNIHKSLVVNKDRFSNRKNNSNNTFCAVNYPELLANVENINPGNQDFYEDAKIYGDNLINIKDYKKKWIMKKNRTINILNDFSSIGNYYDKRVSLTTGINNDNNEKIINNFNNDKLKEIDKKNNNINIPNCTNCREIEEENNNLKNQINSMKIEMNNLNFILNNLAMKLSNLEEQNSILKTQNDQITRMLNEKNNNN